MTDPVPPLSPQSYVPYDELTPVRIYMAPRVRHRYWLHSLLLLLTFFSTLAVGAKFQYNFAHQAPIIDLEDDSLLPFPLLWIVHQPSNLLLGLPFAISLMGILLAHEMGHYLYCRKYHVAATLPFFLPAPTVIGTLGAFIRIKSPIRTRSALFDIGIGGPIAGFVVALPLLFVGLALSRPVPAHSKPLILGLPLVFSFVHHLCGPAVPLDRVELHPVAIAAWFGMFATSLNLLPGGQLDGGHIVASLWPRAHRVISVLAVAALLAMSWYFFTGWLLWAIFLLIAIRHPWIPDQPALDSRRLWIALLGVVMLAITITPRPFRNMSLPEVIQQFRHGG